MERTMTRKEFFTFILQMLGILLISIGGMYVANI
jgi:hypothetical protein